MTHLVSNSLSDSADHWLAYRYLTGELSDDEAAACEARLADDLSLQLALAECVSLVGGLARLSQRAAVRPTSRGAAGRDGSFRPSPVWAAAAVGLLAVGLLFTSALVAPQQMAWQDGEGPSQQVLNPSSVVAMWSQLGDESETSPDRSGRGLKFDAWDDEELDIPDWMLVAVLDESDESDEIEPRQEHQL
jgi:hypothetical protein